MPGDELPVAVTVSFENHRETYTPDRLGDNGCSSMPDHYRKSNLESAREHQETSELLRSLSESASALHLDVNRESRSGDTRHKNFGGGVSVSIYELFTILGGAAGVAALLKAAQPTLVQWLKGRANRSFSVKSGGVEIKVTGSSDVERAIKLLGDSEAALTHSRPPASPRKSLGKKAPEGKTAKKGSARTTRPRRQSRDDA